MDAVPAVSGVRIFSPPPPDPASVWGLLHCWVVLEQIGRLGELLAKPLGRHRTLPTGRGSSEGMCASVLARRRHASPQDELEAAGGAHAFSLAHRGVIFPLATLELLRRSSRKDFTFPMWSHFPRRRPRLSGRAQMRGLFLNRPCVSWLTRLALSRSDHAR